MSNLKSKRIANKIIINRLAAVLKEEGVSNKVQTPVKLTTLGRFKLTIPRRFKLTMLCRSKLTT